MLDYWRIADAGYAGAAMSAEVQPAALLTQEALHELLARESMDIEAALQAAQRYMQIRSEQQLRYDASLVEWRYRRPLISIFEPGVSVTRHISMQALRSLFSTVWV
jgi:hypothetical protein